MGTLTGVSWRCWEGTEPPVPGSQPPQTERDAEGTPGVGREEDVTRKQLEMQALGKLEQLQPSPGAGSWQEQFGQKTPPQKIQRVVAVAPTSKAGAAVAVVGGEGSKAGSEDIPEAQNQWALGSLAGAASRANPLPVRQELSRNRLRDLDTTAVLLASPSSRLISAQLLSPATTSIHFFFFSIRSIF